MQLEESIKKITNVKWTLDEDDMLKMLVKHHGEDFNRISEEINFTYQYQKMTMWQCKKRWRYSQNPDLNRKVLSIEELNLMYRLYMHSIVNSVDCYWDTIVKQFRMRTKGVLRQRFTKCLSDTIRKLALMYANEKLHLYYFYRIDSLCQLTLNMVLYFSIYEAQKFELQDQIFSNIYNSCQIVQAWIHYHFNRSFLDMHDISAYLDRTVLKELPKFTEDEVAHHMEQIILLDTLNRVCFNFQPYELQENQDHKMIEYRKKQLILYKNPDTNSIKIQRPCRKNRTKNNITLYKLQAIFTPLDKNEISTIQNSDTLRLLLPIQSLLQKRSL